MLGFAEEVGLVRRHHVDQVNGFLGKTVLIEQEVAIVVEGRMIGCPKTAPQPPLEHRQLGRRHLDAAIVVDEPGKPLEIALADPVARQLGFHRCCHTHKTQYSGLTRGQAADCSAEASSRDSSRARSMMTTKPFSRRTTPAI
ncbi:hypothetical protein RHECNPAF_770052 [Rhizobium etli CNPAF512]|nr:hypothetical protein RHECNPAF_770052 [Rhizobium etli CNPAF512]